MEKRKGILVFLLFVSMLILAIDVLPHHHHAGVPCLQPVETETPVSHSQVPSACSCIDAFYAASNIDDTLHEFYCNHYPATTLLAQILTCCLLIPERIVVPEKPVYIENLHDTHVLCQFGLRAPPAQA